MPKKIAGSEARKANLNMRTTQALRSRLETAAAASGRALAHEVEHRLEQSFNQDEIVRAAASQAVEEGFARVVEIFGGEDTLRLAAVLSKTIKGVTGTGAATLSLTAQATGEVKPPPEWRKMMLEALEAARRDPSTEVRRLMDEALSGSAVSETREEVAVAAQDLLAMAERPIDELQRSKVVDEAALEAVVERAVVRALGKVAGATRKRAGTLAAFAATGHREKRLAEDLLKTVRRLKNRDDLQLDQTFGGKRISRQGVVSSADVSSKSQRALRAAASHSDAPRRPRLKGAVRAPEGV